MSSQNNTKSPGNPVILSVLRWFDSEASIESIEATAQKTVDWLRIVPLLFLHSMCLGVFWIGWSWTAVGVGALLYFIRMFATMVLLHATVTINSFDPMYGRRRYDSQDTSRLALQAITIGDQIFDRHKHQS